MFLTKTLHDTHNNPLFILRDEAPYYIEYGNEKFYKIFGGDPKLFNGMYQDNLSFTFPKEKAYIHISQIESGIQRKDFSAFDIELELVQGSKWFYMNLQKMESGEHLYGFYVPIMQRSRVIEQLSTERKYFAALQELSKNDSFRMDIKAWILQNPSPCIEESILPEEIHDFPQCILNKQIIHPYDVDI